MASIADLILAQGREQADRRRRSGERRGALVTSLAQLPGQIAADKRQQAADALVAQRASRQDQLQAQQLTAGTADVADRTRASERERKLADVLSQPDVISADTGEFDLTRAMEHARAKGYADIAPDLQKWDQEHDAKLWQTASAKALATQREGPPKLIERDPAKDLADPVTGEIVARGVAKVEKEMTPTEASLALLAARGDRQAESALGKLRALRESRQIDSDPLSKQTEWAIPPGATEPQLMTKEEIRRTGAKRPAGADKPSSGQQKRALGFFNRAQQADNDLEGLEPEIAKMGLAGQTWQQVMPNFLQTDRGQLYTQAQRAFTEARLRKDSGAAIPEQEFANDRRTYFVQPGDSEATIAQKRRARGAMLASLGFESGQALGEFLGDADEAKTLIDGYKSRSTKPAAGAKTVGRFEVVDVK